MQLLNTLYLTTPETYLRLDNDTLRVEVDHETRLRVPLHHLSAVVCFGHIGLSAPLMHRLAEGGIALVLLDDNGRFKGNWGQIKIYKQALSLHLIATSLIAVRAYQASATAIFDYSS